MKISYLLNPKFISKRISHLGFPGFDLKGGKAHKTESPDIKCRGFLFYILELVLVRPKVLFVIEDFVFNLVTFQQAEDGIIDILLYKQIVGIFNG